MSGQDYAAQLLSAAIKQYPFIEPYQPVVTTGSGQDDFAETWPVGEPGDAKYPRPQNIPLDKLGVQVFRPGQFSPNDLAAEVLHIDPYANATRDKLLKSLTPEQMDRLKQESLDYQQSVKMGLPEDKALANAVDSALRGYTVGQWPQSANVAMGYDNEQLKALNDLRSYMQTGVYPLSYRLPLDH